MKRGSTLTFSYFRRVSDRVPFKFKMDVMILFG